MTQDQVQSQHQRASKGLRFESELEVAFQQSRAQMMRERARPVAASALILFLLYSVLDWWFFPASLSSQTVAVRLLVICPMVLSVLILSYRMRSATLFAYYYILSYLWGGLSLLFIIWLSRRQGIDMPYDGVLLMLMFGFFLMGLPFRSVTLTSTLIVMLYIALELVVGTALRTLMFNSFFLITAYLIGAVGSWLQEYQLRMHFLDRTQLAFSRSAAEDESARKTQLLAAAGHDLRQPLNVINLLLENLGREQQARSRAEIMEQLRRTVAHFGKLLSSLLDLSRLREGLVRPRLVPLSVPAVLNSLLAGFSDEAREKGVRMRLSPSTDLGVHADPALLHRVLQNLISNALAHSEADTLDIEVASQFERVRIWIRDNGRGVPRESEPRLFEAFFRGDAGRASQGLGLGLSIVQQLVELMKGRCGYEPGEKGSCFWVEFPRAPVHLPTDATALPVRQPLLLVEDDNVARQELERLLGSWGFEVVGYPSAEMALEGPWLKRHLCRGSSFLVLTDLHLPGIDGFELLGRLRKLRGDIAAVVVTGDCSEMPRYNAQDRTWVMNKPVVPARLRAALQRLR